MAEADRHQIPECAAKTSTSSNWMDGTALDDLLGAARLASLQTEVSRAQSMLADTRAELERLRGIADRRAQKLLALESILSNERDHRMDLQAELEQAREALASTWKAQPTESEFRVSAAATGSRGKRSTTDHRCCRRGGVGASSDAGDSGPVG